MQWESKERAPFLWIGVTRFRRCELCRDPGEREGFHQRGLPTSSPQQYECRLHLFNKVVACREVGLDPWYATMSIRSLVFSTHSSHSPLRAGAVCRESLLLKIVKVASRHRLSHSSRTLTHQTGTQPWVGRVERSLRRSGDFNFCSKTSQY